LGASWSTDQKPVWFVAFQTPVQSGDASLRIELELELTISRWLWERGEKGGASLQKQAMLIPGHYLKCLKPISHPYGDVLLAKYRACARGHVLEHQRVTNQRQKSRWNASPTLGKSNIAPLNPKWVRGPPSGPLRGT